MESCRPGMPEEYVNVTLRKDEHRRTYVNATIIYYRDFTNNLDVSCYQIISTGFNLNNFYFYKQSVEIYRCKNKESPDTCIHFTTLRLMNSCGTIASGTNQFCTPFYQNIKPPITCPMKKVCLRQEITGF